MFRFISIEIPPQLSCVYCMLSIVEVTRWFGSPRYAPYVVAWSWCCGSSTAYRHRTTTTNSFWKNTVEDFLVYFVCSYVLHPTIYQPGMNKGVRFRFFKKYSCFNIYILFIFYWFYFLHRYFMGSIVYFYQCDIISILILMNVTLETIHGFWTPRSDWGEFKFKIIPNCIDTHANRGGYLCPDNGNEVYYFQILSLLRSFQK